MLSESVKAADLETPEVSKFDTENSGDGGRLFRTRLKGTLKIFGAKIRLYLLEEGGLIVSRDDAERLFGCEMGKQIPLDSFIREFHLKDYLPGLDDTQHTLSFLDTSDGSAHVGIAASFFISIFDAIFMACYAEPDSDTGWFLKETMSLGLHLDMG